jgi:hypothetical protein
MAKRRTTPELNLQKELPQVLSTDFNLFYKPDVAPRDKSVDAFTKSLDAFVSGAGTDLVIGSEIKQKQENEAQAIKDYNENRDKFTKQVETGSIPKEANPYYIEKLQELHLNKKAEDFKIQAYRNYAEAKLNKNTNVGAFDSYYEDQLKNFVAENQLGTFSPEKLEKGFFSKTSGTRNALAQTHAQNQLNAVGDEFDALFKENIQIFLNSDDDIETMGENISIFVQDAVKNGAGKLSARNLLLDSLKDYLLTTSDFEGASRIIRELPKNINLSGLGALGDVKALENDFNELKEALDKRQVDKDALNIRRQNLLDNKEQDDIYASLDVYDNFEDYSKSSEYAQLTAKSKRDAENIYANHFSGYAQRTSDQSRSDVEQLILESKFTEARAYLKNNQSQFSEAEFNKIRSNVLILEATKTDGLLEHDLFKAFQNNINVNVIAVNKGSPTGSALISPALGLQFKEEMAKWLANNPLSKFNNDSSERETKFLEHVAKREKDYMNVINQNKIEVPTAVPQNQGGSGEQGGKETFDPNKLKTEPKKSKKELRNPEIVDKELSIDLSSAVIIPDNLKASARRKFIRDNPNALTQEEFDRIKEKQDANKQEVGE